MLAGLPCSCSMSWNEELLSSSAGKLSGMRCPQPGLVPGAVHDERCEAQLRTTGQQITGIYGQVASAFPASRNWRRMKTKAKVTLALNMDILGNRMPLDLTFLQVHLWVLDGFSGCIGRITLQDSHASMVVVLRSTVAQSHRTDAKQCNIFGEAEGQIYSRHKTSKFVPEARCQSAAGLSSNSCTRLKPWDLGGTMLHGE